jgi:hypothetical protein
MDHEVTEVRNSVDFERCIEEWRPSHLYTSTLSGPVTVLREARLPCFRSTNSPFSSDLIHVARALKHNGIQRYEIVTISRSIPRCKSLHIQQYLLSV